MKKKKKKREELYVLDHACIYLFLSLPKKDNLKPSQNFYFWGKLVKKNKK